MPSFDLGSFQAILPEIIIAVTAAVVLLADLWLGVWRRGRSPRTHGFS